MSFFEDGGLKDEGGMVDEVSGNEVPSGSTRKEVRDDIPANISEGEFIFPADVVRYLGLEKLMQMRQMAKMGLKEMEAMGQMGNSDEATMPDDLPFGMADLIIVEGEDDSEENNFAVGGIQWPVSPADVPIETKVYINEAGNKINIRFQGDKPLDTIPDGYVLFTGEEVTPEPVAPRQGGDGSSPDQPSPKNPFVEAGSWQNAPLDMYIKELDKFTGYTPSVVAGLAGALGGPLIGAAVYAGNKLNKKQILATIDERIEQAKKTDVVGQVAALRAAKDKLMGKGEKENTSIFGKIINTVKGALGLTDEQVKTATTTAANIGKVEKPPKNATPVDSSAIPLSPSLATSLKQTPFELSNEDYISPEEKAALGVPQETKIDPTSDLVDAYDYIAKKQQEETRKRVAEAEQNIDPVTPTLNVTDTTTAPQIPVAAPQLVGASAAIDRPAGAGMTTGTRALLPLVASAESAQGKQQLADIQAQAAQNVLDVVKNAVTGTQVTAPLVGTTMEVDGDTPRESGIKAAALTPSSSSAPKPQGRTGSTTTSPPVSGSGNRDRDSDRNSSPIPRPTPKQAAKKATKEAKTKTANLSPTQKTGGAELDKAYGISGLAKGGMPKKKRGLAARK